MFELYFNWDLDSLEFYSTQLNYFRVSNLDVTCGEFKLNLKFHFTEHYLQLCKLVFLLVHIVMLFLEIKVATVVQEFKSVFPVMAKLIFLLVTLLKIHLLQFMLILNYKIWIELNTYTQRNKMCSVSSMYVITSHNSLIFGKSYKKYSNYKTQKSIKTHILNNCNYNPHFVTF